MNIYYELNVYYNANGGSGSVSPSTNVVVSAEHNDIIVGVNLRDSGFTKTGYRLIGWGSTSSGGVSYDLGGYYSKLFTWTGFDRTINVELYAIWEIRKYTVSYNANGGTGAPGNQIKEYGTTIHITNTQPTRPGYDFIGWSITPDGNVSYVGGDSYTANASVTLYAVWQIRASIVNVVSGTVGGAATIRLTSHIAGTKNTLAYKCGSKTGTIVSNLDGSATAHGYVDYSWTVPANLAEEATGSRYVDVKVICTTRISGEIQGVTSDTKPFSIPNTSEFQPSVSLSFSLVNDNTTINGWGIAIEGFTKLLLSASATAKHGASITSYTFSGPNYSNVISTSDASRQVTTDPIQASGSLTYNVKVYDSRGLAKTATVTVTVYPYSAPAIDTFTAYRSDTNGDVDPVEGKRISASVKISIASCNGNNHYHAALRYKRSIDSSYTPWISSVVSDQLYTNGTDILIANTYDVQCELTDDLGLTTVINTLQVASVVGFALGLYNDRARFGGPCRIAGLECDWDFRLHGRFRADDHFQKGTQSTVSVAAGSVETISVVFDQEFSVAPTVIACLYGTQTVGLGECSCSVYNITTTGFSLRLENNYNSDRYLGATWVAIL